MKFAITKFEQLALTSHLIGQPCPNPEYGRRRLRVWDELGVEHLADALAMAAAVGAQPPQAAEWADAKTPVLVDLNADVVDHLIAATGGQLAGIWADTLTRLRSRLEQLRDKKYELPTALRAVG